VPRIAVIGNPEGWSSQELARAVQRVTGEWLLIDPSSMTLDLEARTLRSDGLDLGELDAIIVKKIGLGYRPEFLDRLEALRFLSGRTRIFSDPERILRVLDRLACTVTLAREGVPMAPIVVTEDIGSAAEAVRRFGCVVVKPLFTSKARGMERISVDDDVEGRLVAFRDAGNHVMYLQKWMPLPGRDLGVVFLGGEHIGTYARSGRTGSWNTAVHQGGRYDPFDAGEELVELARRAQAPFGLDFTCVDVAETDAGPVVWEVSAFGGFRGLKEALGIDASDRFVQHVLECIA